MEIFLTILGLVMVYSWVHALIILFKKLNKTTTYEQVVVITAIIGVALYVIGTI